MGFWDIFSGAAAGAAGGPVGAGIGGFLGGMLGGGGSGPTSWSSQGHKDWVTKYVYTDGLTWMDSNAPGHRMNYAQSVDAFGAFLAQKGWLPQSGDPNTERLMQIINGMANGQTAQQAAPGLGGTAAGAAVADPKTLGSGGPFIMIWPWEPQAWKVAQWYHWLIWVLGAGIIIMVVLWLLAAAGLRKVRGKRRGKRGGRRKSKRSSMRK